MLWQRVLTALPLAALAIWFIFSQSTDALFIVLLLITLVSASRMMEENVSLDFPNEDFLEEPYPELSVRMRLYNPES